MELKSQTVGKTRVTVDLNDKAYARLNQLEADTLADSKADVIRQALKVYDWVFQQICAGAKLHVVSSSGATETVVLLDLSLSAAVEKAHE